MGILIILLLVGATVCFGLAVANLTRAGQLTLVALGLFLWALTDLIPAF